MKASPSPVPEKELDQIAQEFVRLCFSLEKRSPGYVDAYFGPPELKEEGLEAGKGLSQIKQDASSLILLLEEIERHKPSFRVKNLISHLRSLRSKAELLEGSPVTFDQESLALYGVQAPSFSLEDFQVTISHLETLLPGDGPLRERYQALREEFRVPLEKLPSVMERAIQEARSRTSPWLSLPQGENFAFELVKDQPWSGYNWFKGNSQSLIQVNTDLPIYLDLIVSLACHEGYPGHHVFNCLREEELYLKRGWVEFSLLPLFGPDALISEGSANYAIEMVFPSSKDLLQFEGQVLCPLAGLNPGKLELYWNALQIMKELAYVQVEVARRYLDGKIARDEVRELLVRFRLLSPEEADHSLKFIEFYRSYVINYRVGEDLVRSFIEGQGGTPDCPLERWSLFRRLLLWGQVLQCNISCIID
ncbi:MAG: hypothetical protein ACPL7L_01025 [bacterium]